MMRSAQLGTAGLVCFILCQPLLAGSGEKPKTRSKAAVPSARIAGWWQERHAKVNARAAQGGVDLVFCGDSITQGWETSGATVWEQYYGKRRALNLGFSGDQTQHVLWRLEHGNLEGIAPKVVVLMIGTNNSNGEAFSEEDIAEGVVAVVRKIRQKLPTTKVLLLGIFPRGANPNLQRAKLAATNVLIAEAAKDKQVRYLDIGSRFLTDKGTISQSIMPDYLHLSPQGYRIWAEAIEPTLVEMLKDDAGA